MAKYQNRLHQLTLSSNCFSKKFKLIRHIHLAIVIIHGKQDFFVVAVIVSSLGGQVLVLCTSFYKKGNAMFSCFCSKKEIKSLFIFELDAPVINTTASSKNVPAWAGFSTNLTCVAYGNPAPRYIWRNSSGKVSTSEESGILQVTPQEDGFGPYTCTVQNSKGTDNLDIRLVKVGRFHRNCEMHHSSSVKFIIVK